jgi:chromosome segregation ATPase
MSAGVRKLESEKASFKDELARLGMQRDEARKEVVELMREGEGRKKVDEVEKDMEALKGRYEAVLELLGEKEEEVAELRGDVVELKRIYRELVEVKVGGGKDGGE